MEAKHCNVFHSHQNLLFGFSTVKFNTPCSIIMLKKFVIRVILNASFNIVVLILICNSPLLKLMQGYASAWINMSSFINMEESSWTISQNEIAESNHLSIMQWETEVSKMGRTLLQGVWRTGLVGWPLLIPKQKFITLWKKCRGSISIF